MSAKRYVIRSRCLNCDEEFNITLFGSVLHFATADKARQVAEGLSKFGAKPNGLFEALDRVLGLEVPPFPGEIFEDFTCPSCKAVMKRVDLTYRVFEESA
jgi:hypothetical protein